MSATVLPNQNTDVDVLLQNAITYSHSHSHSHSHKFGPVGIAGGYSASEGKGAVYSLGATYAGPASLSAAYQANNKPNTSDRLSSIYTVGAGYTLDIKHTF